MKNSDDERLLVIRNCGESGKYRLTPLSPGDLSEIDEESFDLPFLHPNPYIDFNCSRGLLCIHELEGHIYVLNPKTKQFQFFRTKAEPSLDKTRTSLFGACVGYDSKSDDYKILRVCQRHLVGHYCGKYETFELYSLSKDSWKAIDKPIRPTGFGDLELPYIIDFKAAYVRDKSYWFTVDDRVVSLDWSKESFCDEFDLPPERRPSRLSGNHELVQFNGGDSLGFVRIVDLQSEVGDDYEVWVWSEELKRWDIKFSVSLGGALCRPQGTIYGTFLFFNGMAGKPEDKLHRLVAYEWTKRDCKELGIHNNGFKIDVLCYVESSVALPHGEPMVGSGFLNPPPVVEEPHRWDNYCDCICHEDDSECKCCQPYSDAYMSALEDFAVNGFRILNEEEEVGPDISKKQLALKPTAGNPDAHHLYKREVLNDTEEEEEVGPDIFPVIHKLLVGSIPVLAFSKKIQQDLESSDHHQYKKAGGLNFARFHNPIFR